MISGHNQNSRGRGRRVAAKRACTVHAKPFIDAVSMEAV